jgi:mRNA-degrading endonuclease RelE of RelBE toxin-antitoxin system
MDKTEKLLKKLSKVEFHTVMTVVEQILKNEVSDLDIKKLSGQKDIFRARIGNIRIIFLKNRNDIEILEIMRRSEKTYKQY